MSSKVDSRSFRRERDITADASEHLSSSETALRNWRTGARLPSRAPATHAAGAGRERAFSKTLDFRLSTAIPAKSICRRLAHVHYEGRPEACEASSAATAHARIDDAQRARLIHQSRREILRGYVAAGRKAFREALVLAQIMELGAEVGEIVIVSDGFLIPAGLGQLDRL